MPVASSAAQARSALAALRRVLSHAGAPSGSFLSSELQLTLAAAPGGWRGASRMVSSSTASAIPVQLPPSSGAAATAATAAATRRVPSFSFSSARAGFSGRRGISASASNFSSSLFENEEEDRGSSGSRQGRRGGRGGRQRGGRGRGSANDGSSSSSSGALLLCELLPAELRRQSTSSPLALSAGPPEGNQRQQKQKRKRALSSSAAAEAPSSPSSPSPSSPSSASPSSPSSSNSLEPETPSDREIVRSLTNSILSRNNADLRWRIAAAMGLLVGAKLLSVGVPFLFKAAIDALAFDPSGLSAAPASAASSSGSLPPPLSTWLPASLLLGYGAARAGTAAAGEARNAVFAAITQATMRRTSRSVFGHLLALDLGFHLDRQPGALYRSIDRGSRGINFLLSSAVFNVVPTALEVALVSALLAHRCGAEFAALVAGTVGAYAAFTLSVTSWRTGFRREMNAADAAAGAAALDSLVNYEAVRSNGGERKELQRYDDALGRYEAAALRTATSLAALNLGQAAIFSASLAGAMTLAARGVADGSLSVGDVVLGNVPSSPSPSPSPSFTFFLFALHFSLLLFISSLTLFFSPPLFLAPSFLLLPSNTK